MDKALAKELAKKTGKVGLKMGKIGLKVGLKLTEKLIYSLFLTYHNISKGDYRNYKNKFEIIPDFIADVISYPIFFMLFCDIDFLKEHVREIMEYKNKSEIEKLIEKYTCLYFIDSVLR